MNLFHCFGSNPSHRVDTKLAAAMLRSSRCEYLAVNTHTLDRVDRGDDLPIGYATATLGSVRGLVGEELGLRPVLNINHPTSAKEAVARTRKAAKLSGIDIIKLEVLDEGYRVTRNDHVVEAARALITDGFEVWPLITADVAAFEACVGMGCALVRVMGSPIGARRGIDHAYRPAIIAMLERATVPVMLDGGIGSTNDVVEAFDLGFDSVLVNSCLFDDGVDPASRLGEFRSVVDTCFQQRVGGV